MRGCSSFGHRAKPPMGWLYGDARRATPCVAALRSGIAKPPMGWLYRETRRATPCVAAPRSGIACSHPWGGSTGMRVEPRHAWLLFVRASRSHPWGGSTGEARRATPRVAALRSGIARSHPWGGSTGRRVEPRHAWLLFVRASRSHPWGGSTGMRVAPRHAWLLFVRASREATHGVALRGCA